MKKLFVIILSIILLLGVVGCGGSKEPSDTESIGTALVDAQRVGGFNSFDEMRTCILSQKFGVVRINKDEKFITEGEGSLKLTPNAYGEEASVKIVTGTKYNTLTDYTNVAALTMDFFNDSGEEKNVYINFSTRLSGTNRKSYTKKGYVLKQGYNSIIYQIDRAISRTSTYIDKVEYINVEFDANFDEPYDVYLDNIVAHFDDSEVTVQEKTYAENEINSFDDASWLSYVSLNGRMAKSTLDLATVSICRNPKYIANGSGSMQLAVAVNPDKIEGTTPGVIISGEIIERIEWKNVYAIEFYVCCDRDLPNGSITLGMADSVGNDVSVITALRYTDEWKADGGVVKGGKWYKISVILSDLSSKLDTTKINRFLFFHDVVKSEDDAYSWYIDEMMVVPNA